MVGDSVVGPVVGPDFVAKVAMSHLVFANCLFLRKVLRMENLVHFKSEAFDTLSFVCILVPRLLTLSHKAGGQVGRATGGISFVNMLSAGALGTVRINSDLLHIKVKFSRHFGHHNHNCSAAMNAAGLLSLRHPLHLVNP